MKYKDALKITVNLVSTHMSTLSYTALYNEV